MWSFKMLFDFALCLFNFTLSSFQLYTCLFSSLHLWFSTCTFGFQLCTFGFQLCTFMFNFALLVFNFALPGEGWYKTSRVRDVLYQLSPGGGGADIGRLGSGTSYVWTTSVCTHVHDEKSVTGFSVTDFSVLKFTWATLKQLRCVHIYYYK